MAEPRHNTYERLMLAGVELFVCLTCRAVVDSKFRHDRWHRELARR